MKAKWNEWKNSIKQMRVDKRWFDITCKIISFPFVLLYHILNFCLTFSKVIPVSYTHLTLPTTPYV